MAKVYLADKNHTHTASDVGARPNTWMPTASDVGAVPLDGSVAMSDQLRLKRANQNARMYLNGDSGYAWWMVDDGDFNNRRVVQLSSKSKNNNVATMLRINDYINGANNGYNIFGEHNKELLATTLETLMANGGMSTLQSAIQTTMHTGTNVNFSGTGKGKLFLSCAGSSSIVLTDAITIDNRKVGNTVVANGAVEIEFLNSFNVNYSSGSTLYCTAVFY